MTTYRITTLTLGTGGAVLNATASATTFTTLTDARAAAEHAHGAIRWSHADAARPQWAIGTLTARASAYQTLAIIAPAARGLGDILAELRRRDAPTDLDALRADILARQGRGPAPTPTDGGTAA
ncbi:hypothetical protein QBL07_017930 [Gordonia rubripertincta]|uniref:ESX-1 secretion-associated protein n=1 Tax=Gordonia rubripertincta TaxID=36822 RepID=A0AAW6R5H8_GORRU|nr:hypothetical protein [Gordonia rubripertincta]MDG6779590.1 hypothetical protein [Gordonia rubripertincta]NKY62896.1 hypothetical protein [Gordonia rubripertincta]